MHKIIFLSITLFTYTTHLHTFQKAPTSFGKTHFILGFKPDATFISTPHTSHHVHISPQKSSTNSVRAYFNHTHDLEKLLCDHIAQETKGLYIAMYSLTNRVLAQALIDARKKNPQLKLCIITDPTYRQDRFSKISQLARINGIEIYEYAPSGKQKTLNNIMHHKSIVFIGQNIVCTGSLNWTHSGMKSNQENIVVLYDSEIVQQYLNEHILLQKKCKKL